MNQQSHANIDRCPAGSSAFNFANVHTRVNHDIVVELGNAEYKFLLAFLNLEFRKSRRHGNVFIVIGHDLENNMEKRYRKSEIDVKIAKKYILYEAYS